MPDFETVKIDGTAAQQAVSHILQRVVNDRNFSWRMWGTESMELCLAAEAERTGQSEDDLRRQLSEATSKANVRLREHGADRADVEVLRSRIAAVTETLQKFRDRGQIDREAYERLYAGLNDT